MTWAGWLQIALFCVVVLALVRPLGGYMTRVFSGERVFLAPVLRPVERGFYALSGVREEEQGWKAYALALLAFNLAGFLLLYAILRLQGVLPLNPQGFDGVSADLAFNTAVSFMTNTNWQNYGGETTLSHFSQMAGLTVQNFVSAATGIAVAIAFIRGFARQRADAIGNFWVDLTRSVLYVLLPISIAMAIFLIWRGMPQTLDGVVLAQTLSGGEQGIAVGPRCRPHSLRPSCRLLRGRGAFEGGCLMKVIAMAAAMTVALAAPAFAQGNPSPVSTINLEGQVKTICGAFNTTLASNGVIDVDFGELADVDATAKVPFGGFQLFYMCNDADGFTRTITSQNNGYLFRAGTSGGADNQIPWTMQHGGGSGLGFAEEQITAPKSSTFNGSGAFRSGQGGTVTLRANGTRIVSPGNSGLTTTNVFAGSYIDVVTVAVNAR